MFIVLLKFGENRDRASQYMAGHNEWLQKGFDDNVFLLAGNLQPGPGGGIMAYNASLPDLQDRVKNDPFVAEGVVNAEIIEITPKKAGQRLQFLCDDPADPHPVETG